MPRTPGVQNNIEKHSFYAILVRHVGLRTVRMHTLGNKDILLLSHAGLRKKPSFQHKPTRKSAHKFKSYHSQLFIKNEAVQEEGMCEEHQCRSLSLTFVLRVSFISFVLP